MKAFFFYLIIFCSACLGLAATAMAEVRLNSRLQASSDVVHVSFQKAAIEEVSVPQAPEISRALRVELQLLNSSEYRKIDVLSVPAAKIKDEYQNIYRLLSKEELSAFTLYPGEGKKISLVFELPVNAAEKFELSFEAPFGGSSEAFSVNFGRDLIKDRALTAIADPAADAAAGGSGVGDFNIQYPLQHQAFHPGEKVFVRVDLKNITKLPVKIHVLAFDHLFTDDQIVGRYEIRVPEKAEYQSDVPVVVMVEWDSGSAEPDVISKTVSISITPNNS